MTDTTAPRTAAPPISADEEAKLRESVAMLAATPIYSLSLQWTNDAMARLLATIDREREAIEPLLALVRAAQDVLSQQGYSSEYNTAITSERAMDRLAACVSVLPESIRAAARK